MQNRQRSAAQVTRFPSVLFGSILVLVVSFASAAQAHAQVISSVQLSPRRTQEAGHRLSLLIAASAAARMAPTAAAAAESLTVALVRMGVNLPPAAGPAAALGVAKSLLEHLQAQRCDEALHPINQRASRSRNPSSLLGVYFLGVTASEAAKCLTGGGSFLGLANLTSNFDGASAFVELASSTFGAIKLTAGSVVASAPDGNSSTNPAVESAVQRLIAGGGTLSLRAEYPFLYNSGKRLSLVSAFKGQVAADIPSLGAQLPTRTSNAGIGWTASVQASSDDQLMQVFGQVRLEAIRGSPGYPAANLQLGSGERGLRFGQVSYGILLSNTIVVTASRVFMGSEPLRQFGTQLAISFRNAPASSR